MWRLLNYLVRQRNAYLGHRYRGIYREPEFPVAMWSVHDRVRWDGNARATLARDEALHRRMHETFDGSAPNFFHFVNKLQWFQAALDREREEFLRQKGSMRDAMVDERIKIIVKAYDVRTIVEYLRDIDTLLMIHHYP